MSETNPNARLEKRDAYANETTIKKFIPQMAVIASKSMLSVSAY